MANDFIVNNHDGTYDLKITADLDKSARMQIVTSVANHQKFLLERDFLDEEIMEQVYPAKPLFSLNSKLDAPAINWLKIKRVGRSYDDNPGQYFTIIQKILYACHLSSASKLSFVVDCKNGRCKMYIGILSHTDPMFVESLGDFISGLWPGTICSTEIYSSDNPSNFLINRICKEEAWFDNIYAFTGIPSMNNQYQNIYPATIDKLLIGMQKKNFTYIVVARPIRSSEINTILSTCEDLCGQAESMRTFNFSDSLQNSVNHSRSVGNVKTYSIGTNVGKSISDSISAGISAAVKFVGAFVSATHAVSSSIGLSAGYSYSKIKTDVDGYSTSVGQTLSQNVVNKHMDSLFEAYSFNKKRFEQCKAIGTWDVSAFLLGDESRAIQTGAMQLKSILSGSESMYEPIRYHNISEIMLRDEISRDTLKNTLGSGDAPTLMTDIEDSIIVHPLGECFNQCSTFLNTKELSYYINLPLQSVNGIPVVEHASFAKEVIPKYNDEKSDTIKLGKIYDFGEEIENSEVALSTQSLSMHTFVAGSTGSGKSYTIYKLLNSLRNKGVTFLVIEPVKGEYKHVFGHLSDVEVYTNSSHCGKLLRINPFDFPEGISLPEHIDRLVEIFNACWPMYAAMPSVLRKAVEDAYINCGWKYWDPYYRSNLVPKIDDVLICLKNYINSSEYSADTKGDYKGALEMRLQSLNGIVTGPMVNNGQIEYSLLFDKNAIVDLSHIPSAENKALLMGFLVMKLNEYRMSEQVVNKEMNADLKHVTVIEEAHVLLKQTSTIQSQESSNLVGKSVEMIANSIAEMRTYGEGFIIADQAPALMDQSVIRNTNTKITFSLPSVIDREIVGKAMALNDSQINEIARLGRGKAIVYQNNWVESVVCSIDKSEQKEEYEWYDEPGKEDFESNTAICKNVELLKFILHPRFSEEQIDTSKLKYLVKNENMPQTMAFKLSLMIDEYEQKNGIVQLWGREMDMFSLAKEYIDADNDVKTIIRSTVDINQIHYSINNVLRTKLGCPEVVNPVFEEIYLKYGLKAEYYRQWIERFSTN